MTFYKEEFEILLNHLGWGDPYPILLFMGIEEAKSYEKTEDIQQLKGITIKPVEDEETYNCDRYSIPIAKICVYLSEEYKKNQKTWEDYCKKKLFRKGSRVANINLFPIGKEELSKKFDNKIIELYGEVLKYREIYKAKVRAERFPKIREFVENSNVKAVVCYGRSCFEDFILALQLYNPDRFHYNIEDNLLVFEHKSKSFGVILTNHFSRAFSDSLVERIVIRLKNWNVELP